MHLPELGPYAVAAMLPRIDYLKLLLEVDALAGFLDAMPYISGSQACRDDLDLSLAAVLVGSQAEIPITADRDGGLVASTDGLQFLVPV